MLERVAGGRRNQLSDQLGFGVHVRAIKPPRRSYEPTEDELRAADRCSQIWRSLQRLSLTDTTVLAAQFGETPVWFGSAYSIGLAVLSPSARRVFAENNTREALCDWLQKRALFATLGDCESQSFCKIVSREIEGLLRGPLEAYGLAQSKV